MTRDLPAEAAPSAGINPAETAIAALPDTAGEATACQPLC